MEKNKFKKNHHATLSLESIIDSLKTHNEFENTYFHYSVKPDIRKGLFKIEMGIKDFIGIMQPEKWVFKEVSVLEENQIEYGLLHMEQKLFKNIVGYGINSAKDSIKKRNALPKS